MKKCGMVLTLLVAVLAIMSMGLAACGDEIAVDEAIIGLWTDEAGLMDYEFRPDGVLVVTFMGEADETTYSTSNGKLLFPDPDTGEENQLGYRVEDGKLIMDFEGQEAILVKK